MSGQDLASGAASAEDLPDIEVIIEDAAPAEGAEQAGAGGEAPAAAEAAAAEPEVDYADLKRQLEEERAGRAEERRQREGAERSAQAARVAEVDSRLGQVTSAIGEWTAHTVKLKRELAEAHQTGDYAKVADLTEKVGEAGAVMRQLNDNKAHFERLKKAPAEQPRQPAPAPASGDPVEAFAAGRQPKAQAWIRANPDFVRDPKKFQRLQGAHHLAVADHDPNSDEYFAAMNRILGIAPGTAAAPAAEPAQRRAPTVAAPVSRGAPSLTRAPSSAPTSIRLSAVEVEMAKAQGMSPQEWARIKLAGQQRSGTTTH